MKRSRVRSRSGRGSVMPAIFAIMALVGLGASVVSAARKTPEADEKIKAAEEEKGEELTMVEKVKAAAPAYAETAIFVLATGVCIIVAGRAHYKAVTTGAGAASLAALYQSRLKKTEQVIKTKFGDETAKEVKKDVVAKEKREAKHMSRSSGIEVLDNHQIKELFFDRENFKGKFQVYEPYTKQWITMSYESLLLGIIHANRILARDGRVRLDDFVHAIGGKKTLVGRQMGWDMENEGQCSCWDFCNYGPWVDAYIDILNMDGQECLAIFYEVDPTYPEEPDDSFWEPAV